MPIYMSTTLTTFNTGFGSAVSIESDPSTKNYCIAVGIPFLFGSSSVVSERPLAGAVYVFRYTNSTGSIGASGSSAASFFTQNSLRTATTPAFIYQGANFGSAVSLNQWGTDRTVLFAGAPGNNTVTIHQMTDCG